MALLEIKNVSKRFGGLKAVSEVSMAVEAGEIAFIVGPNGAGKTTLFNLITSVHQADAAQIIFDGRDITHSSPDKSPIAKTAANCWPLEVWQKFSRGNHLSDPKRLLCGFRPLTRLLNSAIMQIT